MQSIQVKILNPKIGQDPNFPIPQKATMGSAGIDLRACIKQPFTLPKGHAKDRPN